MVTTLDAQYVGLAVWLTENENHQTEIVFQNSLIAKLAAFQFVNHFAGAFGDQSQVYHSKASLIYTRHILRT